MVIHDCIQGSAEWFEVRRGRYTSSRAEYIITPARGAYPKSAATYQYELCADVIRGYSKDEYAKLHAETDPGFYSPAMAYGTKHEPQARAAYTLRTGRAVTLVGFLSSGLAGASTDGMPDGGGVLEIKCPDWHTQLRRLDEGTLPDEYKGQCHMEMVIAGADWCDFYSWHEELPDLLIRVVRNDFTAQLVENMARFDEEYRAKLKKFADMGCNVPKEFLA